MLDPKPRRDVQALAGAVNASQRLDSIDIVRGLALFGVLIVNLVTEFRVSIFVQFLPAPLDAGMLDRAVIGFVRNALELKAFALFSFLFGVGLALQFERLSRTGKPLYWLTRRLLALLAFGLVHLLLVWNGDILTEYALAGLIVLPLLYASPRALAVTAAALFALYLTLPMLPPILAWPDPTWIEAHIQEANRIYSSGNWLQVVDFNIREVPALLPLHVYIFPRTLGLFVLGMLTWRVGLFASPVEKKTAIVWIGMTCGAVGLAIAIAGASDVFTMAGPVCLALAFAAMIVYAVEFTPARRPLRIFTAIGHMAFTNYIAQSIIFGFIFFGYGLGRFGKLAPAPVFAIGGAVYVAQVQLSIWWLRHYRLGPIEWLWRTLMYGKRQPMKRHGAH